MANPRAAERRRISAVSPRISYEADCSGRRSVRMRKAYDIVIIGGGIIGLSTAWYLAEAGAGTILVLEKDRLGEGSTGRCAGGIRLQFSTEINILFSLNSMAVYEQFEQEFGKDIGFKRHGYLFLATEKEEMEQLERNHTLQNSHGVPSELMDQSELSERWPFLNVSDLRGGAFCSRDGYAGPYEAVQGFYHRGRDRGVDYLEDAEVTAIETDKGRVTTVRTMDHSFASGAVIVASGAYSAKVAALAGVEIPVKPYRRQLFFTAPFTALPSAFPLTIDYHSGWYFRREGVGLLLAGSQDRHSSFDTHTDYDAICFSAEHGVHRVPVIEGCEIQGGWGGSYDITPDCHAILGASEELQGLYLACGFSGHGFMHAPAAGKVVAEIITHGHSETIDASALNPGRFRRGELIDEPMTVFKRE